MILASNNLQQFMDLPRDAVVRVNLAWMSSADEADRVLAGITDRDVFLDFPQGRGKPPTPSLTLTDACRLCDQHQAVSFFAVKAVKSIDGLVGKIKDGDTILLASGEQSTTSHGLTIQQSQIMIRTDGPVRHRIVSTSTDLSSACIDIGSYSNGVYVMNVDFESIGRGIYVEGRVVTSIAGVSQFGKGSAVEFRNAKNVTLNQVTNSPASKWYGCFIGGDDTQRNEQIDITNANLNITQGEHGIRCHRLFDSNISDSTLTYSSPYAGAALAVKDGSGVTISKVVVNNITGSSGFGPLNNRGQENDGRTLTGLQVVQSHFTCDTQIAMQAGLIDARFTDCTFDVKRNGCIDVKGSFGPKLSPTMTFTGCTFTGPKLLIGSTAAFSSVRFVGCTFNGKPV